MRNPCWYKLDGEWRCGFFHTWSQDHEEFDNGPGPVPVAIVEDAETERCHVVYAGKVTFATEDPNPKPKCSQKQIDDLVRDALGTKFEPRLYAVGNHRLMIAHPDCGEVFLNNRCLEVNKTLPYTWLCQVKWKNGELECSQGGLPIQEFTRIFNEVRGA